MNSTSPCTELVYQHVALTAAWSPVEGTVETWTERDKFGIKEGYSSALHLIRTKLCSNRGHGIDLLCILITFPAQGESKMNTVQWQ